MLQIALIGLAAGAASALLFASLASGSLLAVPLFYLAPLPILIAALGWSHLAGLTAALVASAGLGLLFGGIFFLNFLLAVGLPAWWLAYLALLARPGAGPGEVEWYPVGRLVVWAALIASAVVALLLLTIATDAESLRAILRRTFEPLLREEALLPKDEGTRPFVRTLVEFPDLVLPPVAGVLTTIVTLLMLWLAARIVRISGRLRRPWPDLSAMALPPTVLVPLAAALAGSAVLPGLPGIFAMVTAACLVTALGFLGLAVVHALTRRIGGRGFILGAVYGAIVVFGWPMLLTALVGAADMALNLRRRRPGPPSLHPGNPD